ncbi:MAG: PAS domain-containing protein, partial [Pseudomonadota bacterium]|nr:PAS domain-containing protein [Pseudomonadota bacterium]
LGTWDFDPATGNLAWDARCRALFGVPRGAPVTYETFVAALHPDDRAEVLAAAARALDPAGSGALKVEHRVVDLTTGEIRWVSGRGQAFFVEGQASRLIGTVVDVTGRRAVEQALRESEARLRMIADNIPNGMVYQVIREPDGSLRFTYVSQAVERLHGVTAEEVLANPAVLDRQVLASFRSELERIRLEADARQSELSVEIPMRVASGEVRWFHRSSAPRRLPYGHSVWDGVEIDITERKRVEETLREREAELREVLSAAALAIFDVDHATGRVRSSPRLNEIYGYPAERALTLTDLRARYHPEDLEQIFGLFTGAADPAVRHFEMEFRLLLPDGSVRWVGGRGEYLRDEAGRAVRSRGVVLDVTERKRWEERQQLLIHELNHRVKNTLATVQSIAAQSLRNAATAEQARGRAQGRFRIEGADLRLSPHHALALSMALQELATNAVKYGALSNETGKIVIRWAVNGSPRLSLVWTESWGPPVAAPGRRGFGSRLIERSLASDLGGRADLQFHAGGVVCTIEALLSPALG